MTFEGRASLARPGGHVAGCVDHRIPIAALESLVIILLAIPVQLLDVGEKVRARLTAVEQGKRMLLALPCFYDRRPKEPSAAKEENFHWRCLPYSASGAAR